MATVKELKELLHTLPEDYEVVIYPKYSAKDVDGYRKHTFSVNQVCEQEPLNSKIKNRVLNDPDYCEQYFGTKTPESYQLHNHIAIIF